MPNIIDRSDAAMIIDCIIYTAKQCEDPLILNWYSDLIDRVKEEFKDILPQDFEKVTGISKD